MLQIFAAQSAQSSHRFCRAQALCLRISLVAMPLTGYLGTGADTDFFFMFNITKFEDAALFQMLMNQGYVDSFKSFEEPIDFLHKKIGGEWLMWMLIAGHIAMALYHHFVKHDRTLAKMTSGK